MPFIVVVLFDFKCPLEAVCLYFEFKQNPLGDNISQRGNDVSQFVNDVFLVGSYMLLFGNARSEQGGAR